MGFVSQDNLQGFAWWSPRTEAYCKTTVLTQAWLVSNIRDRNSILDPSCSGTNPSTGESLDLFSRKSCAVLFVKRVFNCAIKRCHIALRALLHARTQTALMYFLSPTTALRKFYWLAALLYSIVQYRTVPRRALHPSEMSVRFVSAAL